MQVPRFSYSVQRPYPYSWFTWVTVIGGAVCAVLISLFNVGSNGYYLEPIYTNDRNGTLAQKAWFTRAPFSWTMTDQISGSCAPAELQVGNSISTDKLWRQFEILYIRTVRDKGSLEVPVATYHGNKLENCQGVITVEQNNDTARSSGLSFDVQVVVTCNVNMDPPIEINLSSYLGAPSFRFLTTSLDLFTNESDIDFDLDPKVGLIFADLLSSIYTLLYESQRQKDPGILSPGSYRMSITMLRVEFNVGFGGLGDADEPKSVVIPDRNLNDMSSPDYFHLQPSVTIDLSSPAAFNYTISRLNEPDPLPLFLDRILKLYYSAVLADFGMIDKTVYKNLTLLETWSTDLLPFFQDGNMKSIARLVERIFKRIGPAMVPPHNESTISTQYQCQVPKLKPTSSLITSVFLADLVFLHALWWLLNLITMWWLRRSDTSAMCCEGCLTQEGDREVIREELRQMLSDYLLSKKAGLLEELTTTSQQAQTGTSRRISN